MIYRYETLIGRKGAAIEVEVSEEWGEILIEMDAELRLNDVRNSGANRERYDKVTGKRQRVESHTRLSAFSAVDGALFRDETDILADIIVKEGEQEKRTALRKGIAELQPQQRSLLEKVYIHQQKAVHIAREEGVSEAAISQRLKKIYRKLKKYLP